MDRVAAGQEKRVVWANRFSEHQSHQAVDERVSADDAKGSLIVRGGHSIFAASLIIRRIAGPSVMTKTVGKMNRTIGIIMSTGAL